jgi:hypothetical protein
LVPFRQMVSLDFMDHLVWNAMPVLPERSAISSAVQGMAC